MLTIICIILHIYFLYIKYVLIITIKIIKNSIHDKGYGVVLLVYFYKTNLCVNQQLINFRNCFCVLARLYHRKGEKRRFLISGSHRLSGRLLLDNKLIIFSM